MSAPHEILFKVFYSWQSDLPSAVNLALIRTALGEAATGINADHELNLHVEIDEATRNVTGSPDIADSIFSKIKDADVFVCDLSKVAELTNEVGVLRKYCNPNVAIELGYAIRVLGWNRIIIVFNVAYGEVPRDLPFDAQGKRATCYSCGFYAAESGGLTPACQSQISNAKGNLRATLTTALKLIASESPKRPHELETIDPEVIHRERDVAQLKDIFRWINLNMLERFIITARQGKLRTIGLDFCDFLEARINGVGYHLYDVELNQRVTAFYHAWRTCGQHCYAMEANRDLTELRFVMPGDVAVSREQSLQHRETMNSSLPLREAFDSLLNYVRANYLEIDLATVGIEEVEKYSDSID